MALNFKRTVCLYWPQAVSVMAFMTWRRPDALAAVSVMCGVKVKRGSNVTPRILGFGIYLAGPGREPAKGMTYRPRA